MRFYSFLTSGFYDSDVTGEDMPGDAVNISDELYHTLFQGISTGKRVVPGADGLPVLADALPLSGKELIEVARIWRDLALASTDGIVARHRDQIEAGSTTTLTADQYKDLQAYRQALRDWSAVKGFPSDSTRPVAPEWLIHQIK